MIENELPALDWSPDEVLAARIRADLPRKKKPDPNAELEEQIRQELEQAA